MSEKQKQLTIDRRYKVRKYYRINQGGKIQFSDEYDELLGYIGLTKYLKKKKYHV